jgi:hypothetical protein
MINLPYTYTLTTTLEIAQELTEIRITNQHKLITFDIKDLYVNLAIDGLLHTTNFWLHKTNCHAITQQATDLIRTVLNQNYFQYDDQYYKPFTGIAMGSPLSSTMTEIYLQYFEEMFLRHWLETKEIIYYRRRQYSHYF